MDFKSLFRRRIPKKVSDGIWILPNMLDTKLCFEILNTAQKLQFQSAKQMAFGRNNKEVFLSEPNLHSKLNDQLRQFTIKWENNNIQLEISSRPIELYRYDRGDFITPHTDRAESNNIQNSIFTLVIYLSDDFSGGNTRFCDLKIDLKPKKGSAILFDHSLKHEALMVHSGTKIILRTNCFRKIYS